MAAICFLPLGAPSRASVEICGVFRSMPLRKNPSLQNKTCEHVVNGAWETCGHFVKECAAGRHGPLTPVVFRNTAKKSTGRRNAEPKPVHAFQ
jgi:hypothetical protein